MKNAFKIALKVYICLAVIFTIGFFVLCVAADYSHLNTNDASEWLPYFVVCFVFCFVCILAGSAFYWVFTAIVIWLYHQLSFLEDDQFVRKSNEIEKIEK